MSADLKILTAVLAVSAAIGIGACSEDKKADKAPAAPSATEKAAAVVGAAKDKAADVAAKVADKVEAVKDAAAPKVEAAKEAVKDAAAAVAEKAGDVKDAAAAKMEAVKDAAAPKVEAAKEAVKDAAAAVSETVAPKVEAAKEAVKDATAAATTAVVAAAEAAKPAAAPAAAPAPAAPAATPAAAASGDNAEVQAQAKADGLEFKDARYRNKDGKPVPAVTKDYKVDWATWQGFRRYHDACHVCHGPNALGSTFAPSLGESLKTMDYETFYGIVVGGRVADRGGTKYVMPAFGEDRNIMCYLDDIYTYVKARSNNMADPKTGMPAGRPNGREDISAEAKARAAECEK